jgi:hypothetical protein
MTKGKDDTHVQKHRECVIILLYPIKGSNMSIFNDPKFYYNDLSQSIADGILKALKSGVSSSRTYALWEYPIFIDAEDDLIQWAFDVQYAIDDDAGFRSFDVWGSAGFNEDYIPEVTFTIVLPRGVSLEDSNIDYAELFGAVAHELHHTAQKNEGICEYEWETNNKQVRYYLNPTEIPAFHIGFRAQCALSGADMETEMRSYLSLQDIDNEETELIVGAWMNPNFEIAEENLLG